MASGTSFLAESTELQLARGRGAEGAAQSSIRAAAPAFPLA